VIGEKARDHRGVHGVGHARPRAEQVGALVASEALAPDRYDAVDIGLRSAPHFEARIVGLQIHRQGRAQIAEAGMHLARDGTAAGARGAVLRQESGVGLELGEVLGDRQRVPDHDAVVLEAGDEKRWRQQQKLGAARRIVARHHEDVEVQAGHPAQQEAAQRPRTVVPAVNGKPSPGHAFLPSHATQNAAQRKGKRGHPRTVSPALPALLSIVGHAPTSLTKSANLPASVLGIASK
jgi:hypothetical protein